MKIAGTKIEKGQNKRINLEIAKLISGIEIDVPIIVSRGKEDGPTLLLMAGLHGDEINSVDVLRSVIEHKINQVQKGTVICVPILNIFGFINFSREVPDGKDVNRSFPGHSKGSLASQIAYHLTKKVLPHCDYIIDFHTGGKSRFNIPQTRAILTDEKCHALADAFNAPFTLHANLIPRSLRKTAFNQGKTIIVYEGGEALRFDEEAKDIAISGIKKVLTYLDMQKFKEPKINSKSYHHRKWMRAPTSGFFHPEINIGDKVSQGQIVGSVSGPMGDYHDHCLASKDAYVISLNNNPMVNRGDAIIQLAFSEN